MNCCIHLRRIAVLSLLILGAVTPPVLAAGRKQISDSEMDCIHREKVEAKGSFVMRHTFGERGEKEWHDGWCKGMLEGPQESDSGMYSKKAVSSNGIAGRKPGDDVSYELVSCNSRHEEVPNTRLEGKYPFAAYTFFMDATGVKIHAPAKRSQYLKTYSLPGEPRSEVKLATRLQYRTFADAHQELEEECRQAGGTLTDLQDKSAGETVLSVVRGNETVSSTSIPWRTSTGVCKGNFYYFGEDPASQAEKSCAKAEAAPLDLGKNKGSVDCQFDKRQTLPVKLVSEDKKRELVPRISKDSQLKIRMDVSLNVSFQEQDNPELYKSWLCDRFASCQAANAGFRGTATPDDYSKLCKISQDKAIQGVFGVSDKATESSGAVNERTKAKDIAAPAGPAKPEVPVQAGSGN